MDGCHVAGCSLEVVRQSRAVPSNPGYPQRSPAVPSGPQRSPAVPSGRLQIPFFGQKSHLKASGIPLFSVFGRKMPLLDQKMAENRCRNIDRTCHHHIRSIHTICPQRLDFAPPKAARAKFWAGYPILEGVVVTWRANPVGPEQPQRSRAVPSGPEPSRAVPSGPELPSAATCHGSPCWW